MPFVEIVVSVMLGWFLAMASTWLILARVLPWLDRRMLPPVSTKQENKAPALNTGQPVTGPMSKIVSELKNS